MKKNKERINKYKRNLRRIFLAYDSSVKTIIELSQDAHEDKLQDEGLTNALIYDMISSFSDLERFHQYQVVIDTFFDTKEKDGAPLVIEYIFLSYARLWGTGR